MDEIVRVQITSERDAGEDDLKWAGIMEECRRELSCVGPKLLVGNLGDPVGRMPPKPGEQRQKVMRTGRAGPHLFTSSDEDSEEDAPEGRRARPTTLL